MKLVFISNLFPDAAEPGRGLYNARLLAHLAEHCEVRVISPRPTLPFTGGGDRQPRAEDRAFAPQFPAVPYIPKLGSRWNHRLMARKLRAVLRELQSGFGFERLLGSWVYPDGCAVARLAGEFQTPCAVIAQGTDVHQYLGIPTRRNIIVESLRGARAVIARSRDLARLLHAAGLPEEKITTIYNGVDLGQFQPGETAVARAGLGLPQPARILLYAGNLLPIKNPLLLVEALALVRQTQPDAHLVYVGDGPLTPAIQARAIALGVARQVHLAGRQSPAQLARYMQAADLLCIPSHHEGLPNVLLEALACGLPVVASRVGGIPEVLTESGLGELVRAGDAGAFAAASLNLLRRPRDTQRLRACAARYSWPETARQYLTVLG